jgi:hypothetical protein
MVNCTKWVKTIDYNNVWQLQMVVRELHEGPLGGHFATKITQRKIFNARYWWPTTYINVHDYCRSCDTC